MGVITGTGLSALPGVEAAATSAVDTPFGAVDVVRGRLGGADVAHVSRHGPGHERLSNHVTHQANVAALAQLGVAAVVGCTACGAVDPEVGLGTLVVFDDLHFPGNRLPDGTLATLYTEPADSLRGHWIADAPYAESVRSQLVAGARQAGFFVRDGGTYGHVDGPRYNTKTEIRALAGSGVTAISQTGGPETVLCGEAELPYALVGYTVDYANGVVGQPTAAAETRRLVADGAETVGAVLHASVPRLAAERHSPAGFVYRYEDRG